MVLVLVQDDPHLNPRNVLKNLYFRLDIHRTIQRGERSVNRITRNITFAKPFRHDSIHFDFCCGCIVVGAFVIGTFDGKTVGCNDGLLEIVGRAEGATDGVIDGRLDIVGREVGCTDGVLDGRCDIVGRIVG